MNAQQNVVDDIGAGFAPAAEGKRWVYAGALDYGNAGAVLKASSILALPSEGDIDLRDVGGVDSAAVAVLVALKRRAADEKKPMTFVNVPAALTALAELYGVEGLLDA